MNKAQKEVQQAHLDAEKHLIKLLERVYGQARNDCEKKIMELSSRTDLENLQSIIYQKQYQEALKKQLDGILDNLQSEEFTSIADYLQKSYHNGYTGVMYDLAKQGIPLIIPINQEQVVKALQTDSKLSKGLYARLGEDVNYLKRSIRAELSRGIANGSTWNEIAGKIAKGMNSPFNKSFNRAILIARTEGHRIQQKSALDGQFAAKEKGADVLKQWDSTLDRRTRPHHRQLDGQIRELEEDFEVDGLKAPAPGHFGKASEDCNCRCCLLQRARWALDEDELDELKERAAYFGLDKTRDFEEFENKYLHLPNGADTMEIIKEPSKAYKELLEGVSSFNVKHKKVEQLQTSLNEDEIISRLCGGDMTSGSCSSLGFAYIGNKNGLDVLDFRGGNSQKFFSYDPNIQKMLELPGIKGNITKVQKEAADTAKIIQGLEYDKQYYLAVGKHAAIIRNTEHGAEYLELQSNIENGWMPFTKYGSVQRTLQKRFGCRKTVDKMKIGSRSVIFEKSVVLMEVDSFKANNEFKELLGYINTSADKQKKGAMGNVK